MYQIPSDFHYLSDINQDIYTNLITKHEYIVKSSVNEKFFEKFIKYWEKREIPDICATNIDQYEKLSQEFGIMGDIIQLFKNISINDDKSSLLTDNYNFKSKISQNKKLSKNKTIKYDKIINLLFKKRHFNSNSSFFDVKKEFIKACNQENIKLIDLLTNTIIKSDNDLLFSLNEEEKTATLLRNVSIESEIVIPRAISYKSEEFIITSIGMNSFSYSTTIQTIQFEENSEISLIDDFSFGNSTLKSITIPSSITKIGNKAFYLCSKLQKVIFPENSNLKSIGKSAFSKSSLQSITIPSHVTEIYENAFFDCNKLIDIQFSNNSKLRFIKNGAFYMTSIVSLTIPESVTQIGKCSFAFCKKLDEVKFLDSCSIERSAFNYSFIDSIQFPSNITLKQGWCEGIYNIDSISIIEKEQKNIQLFENKLILGKSNSKSDIFDVILFAKRNIEEIIIPSFIKGIAAYSFNNCERIEKFEIENDSQLQFIDTFAFADSSIDSIIIPPQVKKICTGAFNSYNLTSIKFTENSMLYSFEKHSISWSCLTSLSIPSSVCEFNAGWCCNAEKLIDINIFPNNNIENIVYFDNKFILGKSDLASNVFDILIFARRDVSKATIPSFITKIRDYSFDNCVNFEYVDFEENSQLKIIDECAFSGSSIKKINLPQSVIELKNSCFSYCDALKECILSENSQLKSIGEHIFMKSAIETLSIPSNVLKIDKNWCNETSNLISINVILNKNKQNILNFENKLILGKLDQINDVFDVIIFGRRDLTEIIIPSFIKRIENHAFENCKIKNVTFSKNSQLISIGRESFHNTIIKRIIIPDSVKEIGMRAFYDSKKLENVTFSDKSILSSIENDVFRNTSLISLYIPPYVKNIGFLNILNIQIIEIDENSELISINKNIFQKNSKVMIMIPEELNDLLFINEIIND